MKKNYKKTLLACYLGFITQAITANFAPLLFLRFHNELGISLGKIALISTAYFFTQLLTDLVCARFIEGRHYRKSVIVSEIVSSLGLVGLATLPNILPDPFTGIIISVVLYAIGSGLIEVIVSPIVEACPFENKDGVMSLLHSFYCWGSVGVILLSTAFFALFGMDSWRILACIWAILPVYNIFNFIDCPIEYLTEEGQGYSIGKLMTLPVFRIALVLMLCAGASELSMAQWASAYVESALGFSKQVGDVMGPCLFAVAMALVRMCYGKFGEKLRLTKVLLCSGILCVVCYLLAALSENPVFGLVGCVVCGCSVALMWPGTIRITSVRIPHGGTAMFAMLAMAGDMGGSIGPAIMGFVTEKAGDDLKAGMLAECVFPLVLTASILLIRRYAEKQTLTEHTEA